MGFFTSLEESSFATWVREGGFLWAYDLFLTSHAIGMAIVVGLSAAVALRILGFAPRLPLAPMAKLFPFMYAGFWLNAASGLVLFSAYPTRAVTNPGFFIKMGGVVLAILCVRRLRSQAFRDPAALDRGPAPRRVRILAGTLLFLWWGTILSGRLMAYHGIANVERQASIAVFTVTLALLAIFAAVRFLSGTRSTARTDMAT